MEGAVLEAVPNAQVTKCSESASNFMTPKYLKKSSKNLTLSLPEFPKQMTIEPVPRIYLGGRFGPILVIFCYIRKLPQNLMTLINTHFIFHNSVGQEFGQGSAGQFCCRWHLS